MPNDGDTEYPPQFASSDLSALLGQINDFAGVPPPESGAMEMKSAKSPSKSGNASAPAGDLSKRLASGEFSIPVTIVGSQAQRGPYLPGLKDLLIAVTYLRLAEQITTPALKTNAQKLAYELMNSGNVTLASHIAKQRGSKK